MPIERMLRLPEVLMITGVSEPTIRRWRASGHFPSSVAIGPGAIGWRESEVERWQQERFTQPAT